MVEYNITINCSGEADLLRRIALINATFYRMLKAMKLKCVTKADYQAGILEFRALASELSPMVVPGEVTTTISEVG